MLRALVLALLLANAAWWAWSQGWLPPSALPFPTEAGQREPQRVAAQQRPELVRILPTAEARRLAAAACLQTGPFDDTRWPAAAAVVARVGLPTAAWQRVPVEGGSLLRVPEADAAQQVLLQALQEPDLGEAFKPCP
jgi:hypothetical protein